MSEMLQIRLLDKPEDVPSLIRLMEGLADYERLPRPTVEAQERLRAALLSNPPKLRVFLATLGGQTVGYAAWFFTYSTFLARPTLYLEDIFVQPDARGKGVGLTLMRTCAAEAVRQGCARMEWQVLDWNKPSIEFYERQGARHQQDWLPFRLDGDALTRFAYGDVAAGD